MFHKLYKVFKLDNFFLIINILKKSMRAYFGLISSF